MRVDPSRPSALSRGRHMIRDWRVWLPGFIFQTARYGAVGVAVTLLYTGLTIFFKNSPAIGEPVLASLLAFALVVPCSYFGHWSITFQRRHRFLDGWQRFVALTIPSFIVAVPGMYVVTNVLGWPYLINIAFSWFLVPIINYTVLQLWVFSHRRAS